jgi:hypothetical protein
MHQGYERYYESPIYGTPQSTPASDTRIQDDFSSVGLTFFHWTARRPLTRPAGRWPDVLSQFQRSRFRTLKEGSFRVVMIGVGRKTTNGRGRSHDQ